KTYAIFRKRGYRLRLLSAAFRNHMHWSQLIGADAVISPPSAWQKRFNASGIEVRPRIDDRVDPKVVDELLEHFSDFRRAYSDDGLAIEEFDDFAPTVRTLRQFIAACTDLDGLVRDVMLPDPTWSRRENSPADSGAGARAVPVRTAHATRRSRAQVHRRLLWHLRTRQPHGRRPGPRSESRAAHVLPGTQ